MQNTINFYIYSRPMSLRHELDAYKQATFDPSPVSNGCWDQKVARVVHLVWSGLVLAQTAGNRRENACAQGDKKPRGAQQLALGTSVQIYELLIKKFEQTCKHVEYMFERSEQKGFRKTRNVVRNDRIPLYFYFCMGNDTLILQSAKVSDVCRFEY